MLENSQLRSHSCSSSAHGLEFKEGGDCYWRSKRLYFLVEMFPSFRMFTKLSLFTLTFYLHVAENEIILFPCLRRRTALMSSFSIAAVLWCLRAPGSENLLLKRHSVVQGRDTHWPLPCALLLAPRKWGGQDMIFNSAKRGVEVMINSFYRT